MLQLMISRIAICLFLLLPFLSKSQHVYYLKLVDAFSFQPIQIDGSVQLTNKRFTLDTAGNLLVFRSIYGKKLKITADDYIDFEEKIQLKKYRNNTLTIQLMPEKARMLADFRKIWQASEVSTDTLQFETIQALQKKVLSYLNYLLALEYPCDNGMCNYANTYVYDIQFIAEDSIFRINQVTKTQPHDASCEELDYYMQKLKQIFPKFKLGEKATEISLRYTIAL